MNLFIDFFYKKTVIKYTANIYQEDSQTYPSRKQDTSELFFLGTRICTGKGNSVYIQICIPFRWESPVGHETISIERICRAAFGKKERTAGTNIWYETIQWYNTIWWWYLSWDKKLLTEYLQRHDSLKVQLSFFDKRNDSNCKDERAIAYVELQKALFFCRRKRMPLLFVSLKGMIDDIHFLNLLEKSHVDFRCIDFPWFCKENLDQIKAMVLYVQLSQELKR